MIYVIALFSSSLIIINFSFFATSQNKSSERIRFVYPITVCMSTSFSFRMYRVNHKAFVTVYMPQIIKSVLILKLCILFSLKLNRKSCISLCQIWGF